MSRGMLHLGLETPLDITGSQARARAREASLALGVKQPVGIL